MVESRQFDLKGPVATAWRGPFALAFIGADGQEYLLTAEQVLSIPAVPYRRDERPEHSCACAACPCRLHAYAAGAACAWCADGRHDNVERGDDLLLFELAQASEVADVRALVDRAAAELEGAKRTVERTGTERKRAVTRERRAKDRLARALDAFERAQKRSRGASASSP